MAAPDIRGFFVKNGLIYIVLRKYNCYFHKVRLFIHQYINEI